MLTVVNIQNKILFIYINIFTDYYRLTDYFKVFVVYNFSPVLLNFNFRFSTISISPFHFLPSSNCFFALDVTLTATMIPGAPPGNSPDRSLIGRCMIL